MLGALLASACSASVPPGGRETAGTSTGGAQDALTTDAPAQPASRRQTPASRPLPPGRFVTRADDGTVVTMRVGESRELQIGDPGASDPAVAGDAIELIEIHDIQGNGSRSWKLRAVRLGRSRIVVVGNQPFVVTIDVSF